MNMFMQATQNKLRFNTSKGTLSTECLWDLSMEVLNELVIKLRTQVETHKAVGYLNALPKTTTSTDNDNLRFKVAEAVILERVKEVKSILAAAEKKQKREELLRIIASKEAQTLQDTDLASLKEMVEALS